ncbi:MAG: hypothetical protein MI739_08490 [Bacteroidales bacterium]|nr:hypothetical protein [Bacteroidales bacterium]
MYGKETEDKAQKLMNLIDKAIDNGKISINDLYFKQVKTVQKVVLRHMGFTGNGKNNRRPRRTFLCNDIRPRW